MATVDLHDHVLKSLRLEADLTEDCDPTVLAAISSYLFELTPSHSLNSRKFSLLALVKKHLDEPIDRFWKHYSLGINPPLLSGLAAKKNPDIEVMNLVSFIEWENLLPIDVFNHEAFYPTVDAIRYTLSSFQFYGSSDVTALKLEPESNKISTFTEVRAKAKVKKSKDIPHYLMRMYKDRCDLCNKLTESYVESKRILHNELVSNKDKQIMMEGKLNTPNFSSSFCVNHNPAQDFQAYKKAHRRRDFFHSLNRLFIEARRCQKLSPYRYTYVLRVAFEISTGNSTPLKTRKAVLQVLDERFNTQNGSRTAVNLKLIALAHEVINSYNAKNKDQPPLDFLYKTTRL